MSQFISLESAVDDDLESEFSSAAGNEEDLAFIEDSESTNGDTTHSSQLNNNENLEFSHFLDHVLQKYSPNRAPSEARDQSQNSFSVPQKLLPLTRQPQDWGLYQVQCTPGSEFELVEFLLGRNDVHTELRSVFFNSNEVGTLYLEAQFRYPAQRTYTETLQNPSLLEILEARSDVWTRTLRLVPQDDWWRCLYFENASHIFRQGEWVEILRGLYAGDVGIVYQDQGEDLTASLKVLVLPRMNFAQRSLKRECSGPRPMPRLLYRESFPPDEELHSEERKLLKIYANEPHTFSVRGLGTFSYGLYLKSCSPGSLIPASTVPSSLKDLFTLSTHPFIHEYPMPFADSWYLTEGDRVRVELPDMTQDEGYIYRLRSAESSLNTCTCEVMTANSGLHNVRVTAIRKIIQVGDSVVAMSGPGEGKAGIVVAQIGSSIQFLDLTGDVSAPRHVRVHVNCLQVVSTTEPGWEPDIPWKNLSVRVSRGAFRDQVGLVKNVWPNGKGSLRIELFFPSINSVFDFGYEEVQDLITGRSLLHDHPLHPRHQERYQVSVCSALEPDLNLRPDKPWVGTEVLVRRGTWKSYVGVIRDVERYTASRTKKIHASGIRLTIELNLSGQQRTCRWEKIDYDYVLDNSSLKLLVHAQPLKNNELFFTPNLNYIPHPIDEHQIKLVRLNRTRAQEIFRISVPTALIPVQVQSQADDQCHWIMHPNLQGIGIRVDIDGGEHDTFWQKKAPGKYVKTVPRKGGGLMAILEPPLRRPPGYQHIPTHRIRTYREPPKPNTDKSRMVIIGGDEKHIGKFVRPLHYFYQGTKSTNNKWFIMAVVDCSGSTEVTTGERLELPPNQVERTREQGNYKAITAHLESLRADYRAHGIEERI